MTSINVGLDYFEHRKTRRLIGLLGRGAEVIPIRLWAYCGRNHRETGELAGYSEKEIESLVGWWGVPGGMLQALLAVGFVEKTKDGWKMHEWEEYQGHIEAYRKKASHAAKQRWARVAQAASDAPSIAPGNAPSIPASDANTGLAVLAIPSPSPTPEMARPAEEAATAPPHAFAEKPTKAEFLAECAKYDVPAWYAERKFRTEDEKLLAWRQFDWRKRASTVGVWWTEDGRPQHPPKRRDTASSQTPSVWELKTKLEAVESELTAIKGRGHESPLGLVLQDKDKARYKELCERKRELKKGLAA